MVSTMGVTSVMVLNRSVASPAAGVPVNAPSTAKLWNNSAKAGLCTVVPELSCRRGVDRDPSGRRRDAPVQHHNRRHAHGGDHAARESRRSLRKDDGGTGTISD